MASARPIPILLAFLSGCSGGGSTPGIGDGAAVTADGGDGATAPGPDRWLIDSLTAIHGRAPVVMGSPTVTPTPHGDALCFDGDDAVVLDAHPLEGRSTFTLEALVRIDGVTSPTFAEPRFLHIEAPGPARATMEARVTETTFYLDTFLLSGGTGVTLADSAKAHPVGGWSWTALTYDGTTMRHYVDGVEDASGPAAVSPIGAGKMSLGVRQNLVYWFVGCIREVRATAGALPPEALQRLP